MDSQSNTTPVPTVQIGGVEITPLSYKRQVVITTELLATEFETSAKNILDNFQNNLDRFELGKHYHRVHGDELKALKNSPDFIGVVSKHTPSLILWTERGVARHAKILDTDAAWEKFERLEDVYFAVKAGLVSAAAPLPRKLKEVGDVMAGFSRLVGLLGLKGNQRALSAAMATYRETGVDVLQLTGVTHLDSDVQQKNVTPTVIGSRVKPPPDRSPRQPDSGGAWPSDKGTVPDEGWDEAFLGAYASRRGNRRPLCGYDETASERRACHDDQLGGTSVVAMVQTHIGGTLL